VTTRTAAQLIVECLIAEGCEYVFSVPGEETMDILDALSDHRVVRHITTRHEQGAAFMADVYGRLTGRAAVAMGTLGPGATNLVTGIADAYLDRAPMVAITGQASSDKLHKEAHQVVDIVRMIEPVTKWSTRVERVEAIPEIVRKAFRVAILEKPGPTHIELPENVAATVVDDATRPLVPGKAYFPGPTNTDKGWKGELIPELAGDEMSVGMTKFYRRECFQQIGGFVRQVMWDGIDCHRCRMLGWLASSWDDPELRFIHLRPMGSSHKGIITGRKRHGFGQYFMGTSLLYMTASAALRATKTPYLVGGAAMWWGFVESMLKSKPRFDDAEFRSFLRRYQWECLIYGKRAATDRLNERQKHEWRAPAPPATGSPSPSAPSPSA